MKYATWGSLAAISGLALTSVAQGRGMRSDAPCPFAGGANAWALQTTDQSAVPFNPGSPTQNFAELTSGSGDDFAPASLATQNGTMYNWYANPLPAATNCGTTTTSGGPFIAPSPIEQVMVYTLTTSDLETLPDANGNSLNLSDDTEVAFNYATAAANTPASFTMDGITFKSNGILPVNTQNDFLFGASGQYIGAISEDGFSVNVGAAPVGWTMSNAVASAPELDSGSFAAAITLLLGSLAVLRGSKRTGLTTAARA
jgi:hypothetical protein